MSRRCSGKKVKNVFMIFVYFKTGGKTSLKIEKTWFLLVHWVAKNGRLIFLCHFHKKVFQGKMLISKKRDFLSQTFVFLAPGKPGLSTSRLYFFFYEYHELRFKGKLQHKFFPVNFARFLRTRISYNTCKCLPPKTGV